MTNLRKLLEEVHWSINLLSYKEDWDHEGGLPANEKSYNHAMIFIHLLAAKIDNLPIPYFDITRSGGVSMEFKTESYKLFIICSADSTHVYGHKIDTEEDEIRGEVITKDIISWINKYMIDERIS